MAGGGYRHRRVKPEERQEPRPHLEPRGRAQGSVPRDAASIGNDPWAGPRPRAQGISGSAVPERAQESVPPVRFTQAAKVLEKLLKEASSAVLGSLCDRRGQTSLEPRDGWATNRSTRTQVPSSSLGWVPGLGGSPAPSSHQPAQPQGARNQASARQPGHAAATNAENLGSPAQRRPFCPIQGRGLRHAEGPRVSTETLPPPSGEEGTLPLTPGPPPPTPADPAPGPDPRLRAPPPGPASGLQPSEPSNPRGRLRPRAHSSEVGADPSGPRPHAWELAGPGPMRGSIRPGPRADLDPPGLPRAAPRPRPVPRGVPRRGGAPQPASMRLVAPPDGADRGRGAGRPDGPGPEGRAERGMPGSVVPRAFGPPLQRARGLQFPGGRARAAADFTSQEAAREKAPPLPFPPPASGFEDSSGV
ncbi:basic salivary proline-rich protein 1-like [Phocoena phocoena]|uniref:basic salivary proline-rich protein 1-like n=1 Tax=Phocoena phocoena TaxID=9742 RepID=UPI003306FE8B